MKKILNLLIVTIITFIGIRLIDAKALTYGFDTTDCTITGTSEICELKLIVYDGTLKFNEAKLNITFNNITYSSFNAASGWSVKSNVAGSSSSIREIVIYSQKSSYSAGTYTLGTITAVDATYGCSIIVSFTPNTNTCKTVTVGDTTIYYDNNGNSVSYYQYRTQCENLVCEIIEDDNKNTIYYGKNGNVIDETTYNTECLGKIYCKLDNTTGKYYDNNGNETTYLQFEKECNKHSCEIITDGTNTVYFDSNGNEVNETDYYNDSACHDSCGVLNGIYFDLNGKKTTELEYKKQCLENKCTALSDGTYYGKDGKETTQEDYLKQCFSCIKLDGKYFDVNGKEITSDEYDIQCNTHKCEVVNNTYFNKEGNIVDEATYNLVCNTHKCEKVNDKYFDATGNIVSEEEFSKSCGVENPATGNIFPILYITIGISISGILLYISKKYKKIHN